MGGREHPGVVLVAVFQGEDGSLLVHDPEIKAVVRVRPCVEEMIINNSKGICVMIWILVQ